MSAGVIVLEACECACLACRLETACTHLHKTYL